MTAEEVDEELRRQWAARIGAVVAETGRAVTGIGGAAQTPRIGTYHLVILAAE